MSQPKLGLIIRWLDTPSMIMLMVGPNRILTVEAKAYWLDFWGKIKITRNYLEKQLVMNLPLDVHGLTNQSWACVQSKWILVPAKELG